MNEEKNTFELDLLPTSDPSIMFDTNSGKMYAILIKNRRFHYFLLSELFDNPEKFLNKGFTTVFGEKL